MFLQLQLFLVNSRLEFSDFPLQNVFFDRSVGLRAFPSFFDNIQQMLILNFELPHLGVEFPNSFFELLHLVFVVYFFITSIPLFNHFDDFFQLFDGLLLRF